MRALSNPVALIPLDRALATLRRLRALGDRCARLREIAGFHYPSDSRAGIAIADHCFAEIMRDVAGPAPLLPKFRKLIADAEAEWP